MEPIRRAAALLALSFAFASCSTPREPQEAVPATPPPDPPPAAAAPETSPPPSLTLGEREYFAMPGLDVMVGSDFYPEGHQGGVSIIQNGLRTASNGDLRLEPAPGQWQPVPKLKQRVVDREAAEIRLTLAFPDPDKNRKGFNPIDYPELELAYTIRVRPDGRSFRIFVDLDAPLPPAWVGKVGFNLELFPGNLFGKAFQTKSEAGLFPRQPSGPGTLDEAGHYHLPPLATGRILTIAPEDDALRMVVEVARGDDLQLLDGRGEHNNGWFILRSTLPAGATEGALEWRVSPNAIDGWRREPAIQLSSVGYHPEQEKFAIIELDAHASPVDHGAAVELLRIGAEATTIVSSTDPASIAWGTFLRYRYLRLDFSATREPGLYRIRYGSTLTPAFEVSPTVYRTGVWQPTLETFLPVQMCHMRVNDRYRVWHGACHLDDARMAPTDLNHFDGYVQGPSTLTRWKPGDHVPGLDRGGWHDAGDHDLRVESQADTIYGLALVHEAFDARYDNTTIDQEHRVAELHRPDGKADVLQQIEHGMLSVVGGYRALGRLYRGIITPTLRQYVLLGDPATGTDNRKFDGKGPPDDNWVFTEEKPAREISVAAGLAAGARALRSFNPELSRDALAVAQELWTRSGDAKPVERVPAAVELLLATGDAAYEEFLKAHQAEIAEGFAKVGWVAARSIDVVDDPEYRRTLREAATRHQAEVETRGNASPYGIPYEPNIWGAGWAIQRFGVQQFYLHAALPDIVPNTYFLRALNFILGCHPGTNTASFVSGVGARSLTTAYGINRGDESYIPGGIGSGTALIQPDFPELLDWPFLWQQTEYVLGYGTTDFLTLALAADQRL